MNRSIPDDALHTAMERVREANAATATAWPGDTGTRRPIHTVYGGANLFRHDTARKFGRIALKSLDDNAPSAADFAKALAIPPQHAEAVYDRVRAKLTREPVEDYRLDFEDGYGFRPDAEEDDHAISSAHQLATAVQEGSAPPFIGFRIKSFSEETRLRAARTLDLFLTSLLDATENAVPANFVVCLPKVANPDQVGALADLLDAIEHARALPHRSLKLEILVETTQAIFNQHGEFALPAIARAARGRCMAAHLGAFDFTSSQNVAVAAQAYTHPANDFARQMLQVAFAGTGIRVVDSVTNTIPKGDTETVRRAWRIHADHVRHSLQRGIYQGWDLHPAQIPARYAAVYSFFLEGAADASQRLKAFLDRATQATIAGDVFDDAASGQGMLNFFLQAIDCGAIPEDEAATLSGLSLAELRSASFPRIAANRV